jgi:hypothetical protein
MRNRCILVLIGFFAVCAGRAGGAFDEAEWKKTYDHPKVRAVTERWLNPDPELEKQFRESASADGTLPKDPVHADKYVKEYVAFYSHFYLTIYFDCVCQVLSCFFNGGKRLCFFQ